MKLTLNSEEKRKQDYTPFLNQLYNTLSSSSAEGLDAEIETLVSTANECGLYWKDLEFSIALCRTLKELEVSSENTATSVPNPDTLQTWFKLMKSDHLSKIDKLSAFSEALEGSDDTHNQLLVRTLSSAHNVIRYSVSTNGSDSFNSSSKRMGKILFGGAASVINDVDYKEDKFRSYPIESIPEYLYLPLDSSGHLPTLTPKTTSRMINSPLGRDNADNADSGHNDVNDVPKSIEMVRVPAPAEPVVTVNLFPLIISGAVIALSAIAVKKIARRLKL